MQNDSSANIATILLVEDNPGDVLLITEAFKSAKLYNRVLVAKDGEIALGMLRKEGAYSGTPTPDIILLDLNLPKLDGREVLAEVKNDDNLKCIPVIIMTSSEAENDVQETYSLHANGYVVKPVSFEKFCEAVGFIEDFWLSLVKLPKT